MLVLVVAISLLHSLHAESDYRFEGPRTPIVRIQEGRLPWKASVSFLGVSCFDDSLNEAVNQEKARAFLYRACAIKIHAQDGSAIRIGGLQVLNSSVSHDGRFSADYLLSHEPVIIPPSIKISNQAKASEPIMDAGHHSLGIGTHNLLTRKSDWLETLDATVMVLSTDYPVRTSNTQTDQDRLCNEIVAKEESIRRTFRTIDAQIEKDHLLLSDERRDLIEHSNLDQQKCLDALKELATSCLPAN